MNKGSALWTSGLPDQALQYYYRARSLDLIIEPEHIIALNNNIAEVFKEKKLYDSALFYYNLGLGIKEEKGSAIDLSILVYNVGELYFLQNESDSASKYYHEAYQSATTNKNKRGEAYALFGLAEISSANDLRQTAVRTHQKALLLREEIKDKRGMIQSYQSLGNLFIKLNKTDSGLMYLRKAVLEAKQAGTNELLTSTYHDLANALEGANKLKLAIKYLHLHHELQDSINQLSFLNSSEQIKNVLMGELMEAENDLLKEHQEVLETENQFRIAIVVFITAVLVFSGLIYYQQRARNMAKKHAEKLEEQNKKLTDSAFVVSHNLREPVTQILGFIELNKHAKDVPQEETWNHMEKAAKTIDEVVRQLANQLHSEEDSAKK